MIHEIYPLIKFFFEYEKPGIELIKCSDLNNEEVKKLLKNLIGDFKELNSKNNYTSSDIEDLLRSNCKELNLKVRDYLSLIRNCITGSEISTPLFEAIEILGINEATNRLNGCLNKIS